MVTKKVAAGAERAVRSRSSAGRVWRTIDAAIVLWGFGGPADDKKRSSAPRLPKKPWPKEPWPKKALHKEFLPKKVLHKELWPASVGRGLIPHPTSAAAAIRMPSHPWPEERSPAYPT